MHYAHDALPYAEIGEGWKRAVVHLGEHDTAWHPGSTKHVIYGPAKVTYEQGPSGAVTGVVEDA